ncbi:hypothetical protein PSU4_17670 [Pseudonocardia sulfidoxydans NBRC 16205]|uniref:Uncharacterized protein n=1 Tax=Pseudonocardia sulfidoxydans NBRC 16205 TaxID=1223511 RepID=A0A511DEH2_9PSEU|nr:hypothetical protein PSU4_17670 [Pseudonocardia sulfidoxydans NBRC 16205]
MVAFAQRGPSRREAEIVTVAELVRRNVPAPRAASDVDADRPAEAEPGSPVLPEPDYVSVGSLMRREGRAPHSFDRPLKPRASRLDGAGDAAEQRASGRRRMTAAAAAMLTIGGVLGAAVFTDAASNSSAAQDQLDGSFPGRGGAGDGSGAALPSSGNALAAGTSAPTSWMNVAFPSALPQAASAGRGGAGGAGTGGAGGVVYGSGGSGGTGGVAGIGGSGSGGNSAVTNPGGGTGGTGGQIPADRQLPQHSDTADHTVTSVTEPVARVVQQAGRNTPLRPVTDGASGAVEGLGNGLGKTLGSAVGTVNKVAEPVTTPVNQVLAPVTKPVKKLAPPLAPALDLLTPSNPAPSSGPQQSVVETVGRGVSDTAGGLVETAGGTVGGLVGGLTGAR